MISSFENASVARVTRRFALLALLALCALPYASLTAQQLQQSTAVEHVVTIENMQFIPFSLKVRAGERVRWVNKDYFPHTATARGDMFDSKVIASQSNWTWVAHTPGDHTYICTLHPSMQATLTVISDTPP
jgi:plastocyanin